LLPAGDIRRFWAENAVFESFFDAKRVPNVAKVVHNVAIFVQNSAKVVPNNANFVHLPSLVIFGTAGGMHGNTRSEEILNPKHEIIDKFKYPKVKNNKRFLRKIGVGINSFIYCSFLFYSSFYF
jgi:hypothetical protein